VKIRVLGCSGAIAKHCRTTSFLLGAKVLIDAGTGVGDLTLDEMQEIDHVFLTHSHLDHIAALPLMLDAVGARRNKPISLYGLQSTLDALKTHIFNDVIWPDFLKIPSADSVPALGYAVSNRGPCWVFTGDTGNCADLWSRVNQLKVGMLVIETAFSNKEMELALLSGHLAPDSMIAQLDHLRSDKDFPIFITHTKPAETELIMREIEQLNDSSSARRCYEIHWLDAGQEFLL
jgi:cAMP phosphodiesterase